VIRKEEKHLNCHGRKDLVGKDLGGAGNSPYNSEKARKYEV